MDRAIFMQTDSDQTCADAESFVRGGPTLIMIFSTFFLFSLMGEVWFKYNY